MATIKLQLDGLHCDNCVKSVEKALRARDSVREVQVDLATQTALVESDETAQDLIDAIIDIGFEAKVV